MCTDNIFNVYYVIVVTLYSSLLYIHVGLAADNSLDNAELYGIIDTLEMLWNKFADVFFEQDPQKKVIIMKYLQWPLSVL